MSVAQLRGLAASADEHYRLFKELEKPDGSFRRIYSVQEPLKATLKKVNRLFSNRCEYPKYLTGSLPGWSYVENAALHTGKGTIITVDATNFFPSIEQPLVEKIWHSFFGFDDAVSTLLAKLCCFQGALAQGSPTSSYLANLAFWDIEPLIVKEFRSRGYQYSRYVDDIAVSHSRVLTSKEKTWAIKAAKKVFLSRGLKAKNRKTKVMDRNRRQEVNKRTVNAGRVCASPEMKQKLRTRIKRFIDDLDSGEAPEVPFTKQYNQIKGQILHFRQFNRNASDKLLSKLDSAFSKE